MGRLPGGIREDIAVLNLADKDLAQLKARLLPVHGYNDNITPYTESIALAAAVRRNSSSLFLGRGLMHVDYEPDLSAIWSFLRAVDRLLAEREK